MRLLDRYLLRELMVPFGYCLSGFLILWVAGDLFVELGDLQEHRLRAGDIAVFYLVRAPEFIVFALPIVLLLALLYTLTNLARHHEITAIRAAGVSLWRLALPYFGVGLAAGVVFFALNELWVPDSADWAERIKNHRLERRKKTVDQDILPTPGLPNTRDGRMWVAGYFDPRTDELRDPWVIWSLPDGSQRWLNAERAVRTNGVWTFFEAQELRSTADPKSLLARHLQTNILVLPEFTETPGDIRLAIKFASRLSPRNARKADIPVSEIFEYLKLYGKNLRRTDQFMLHTKLHGRLAAPWTCLVVVLIALPFGAASGRRNIFVGVASSIAICFSYIILLQLCLALGTGGYLPAWLAAWLPNLLFGATGLWLTARVR